MTSLRKRLDNILYELTVIREALKESSRYPPCCLAIHNDGKVSCDVAGPLPEDEFLKECEKCRARIKNLMSQIDIRSG
ncbi:MAG: hypothetical protein ACE5KC_02270 [Candidatus Bathyarchaeia archaeon]